MGIDYTPVLIVGFNLESEDVQKWMSSKNIEDPYEINMTLNNIYPELSKMALFVVGAGDQYSGESEFYLSFFDGDTKISNIKKITEEHLQLAKKVYNDLTGKELECSCVDDIEIYAVLHVW